MAFHYLDASALVKYYVLEPGSMWVRGLIDLAGEQIRLSAHSILVADVSVAEVSAAFSILHRVNRLRRMAWDSAYDRFMDDVSRRYQLVGAGRDDFFAAADLARQHPLKAYDAVQLAVALRQHHALSAVKQSLIFVCGDKTLLAAAEAEGLATDNPFDHVSPQDTPGRASS